jgi:hypothetical protein
MKPFYKFVFVCTTTATLHMVWRRRSAGSEISCVPTEWTEVTENIACDRVLQKLLDFAGYLKR